MTALSIVIPSNRRSLSTAGRIVAAAAWTSNNIETIVRDNSGDADKRRLLGLVRRPNFKLLLAPPCDATTNFFEAFREARGDFVLFLGDDDAAFDRGILAIAEAAQSHAHDRSVAGITGRYVVENTQAWTISAYPHIDSPDVRARLGGFLSSDGANLIFYSAVRRALIGEVWELVLRHPFRFPFHDQLCSMLYLLAGRFVSVGRLVYVYDNTNWEVASGPDQPDLKIYAAAGMDPAIRWLHWMICGFEGASFIMHSDFAARLSPEERQAAANAWLAAMFRRFTSERIIAGRRSSLHAPAAALCQRWKSGQPNVSLPVLLDEISGFIGLFSTDKAVAYRAYWEDILRSGASQPAS